MPRILMIEDDFDFAEIMVECLQADPLSEVEDVIGTVQDARDRFDSGGLHDIDVVLIDLQLPNSKNDKTINRSGGLELLTEIRSVHDYKGTVIVLTNSNLPADGERALQAGCDGYLCKHSRMSDLPALLNELRMAIRGDVFMFSRELRYLFMRNRLEESHIHE